MKFMRCAQNYIFVFLREIFHFFYLIFLKKRDRCKEFKIFKIKKKIVNLSKCPKKFFET